MADAQTKFGPDDTAVRSLGSAAFGRNLFKLLPEDDHGSQIKATDGRVLLSSYHCSRYNQNTRRLDAAMFEAVFERAVSLAE